MCNGTFQFRLCVVEQQTCMCVPHIDTHKHTIEYTTNRCRSVSWCECVCKICIFQTSHSLLHIVALRECVQFRWLEIGLCRHKLKQIPKMAVKGKNTNIDEWKWEKNNDTNSKWINFHDILLTNCQYWFNWNLPIFDNAQWKLIFFSGFHYLIWWITDDIVRISL